RERERERRVSDAHAPYNAPTWGARTPKHVIPKRNHAKNNSLSKMTRSLSQGPVKTVLASTTKTDPDPTFMFHLSPDRCDRSPQTLDDKRWRQHTISDPTCQVPLIVDRFRLGSMSPSAPGTTRWRSAP